MRQRWFMIVAIIMLKYHILTLSKAKTILKPFQLIRNASLVKINVTQYPVIRKDETIVDTLHNNKIPDPYRYLEDPNSKETKSFVKKLNFITDGILDQSKYKDLIRDKTIKYLNFEKYGLFVKRGEYYYYTYNSGLENHDSLYRKKNLNDEGEKFLDINSLSKDGSTSCSFEKTSLDGKLMAYGLSVNGSDWNTIHFMNVDGETLPDVIKQVKHTHVDFILNNTGFIYSTYPNKKTSDDGTTVSKNEYHSLYYHKMGTPQEDDIIIAEYPSDKEVFTFGYTSDDGRYLFVNFNKGTDPKNKIYYYDLHELTNKNEITKKLELKPLFEESNASYEIFDSNAEEVFVKTDKDAPMGKLFKMRFSDVSKGEKAWIPLVDENKNRKISEVSTVGKKYFITNCLEDIKSSLYVHDKTTGKILQKIDIDPGYVGRVSSDDKSNEFFVSFASQITPTTIFRGNLDMIEKGEKVELEIIKQTTPEGLDLKEFAVKQIFYPSKDGTKVSMFIFHKKDIKLDGSNPTLLEGYGGFGVSVIPSYSSSKTMFVKHFNGIICTANIRGGGEYGERWHEDGMLHKKQNVFDDFIGAAEYLINNNYTQPSKLAIRGGSNGGLLMAAVSQQRPDLYGAVINKVGVLDMLRFHKFTAGGAWISEYGNPEKKEDFDYIIKYSPYHNLKLPEGRLQWPCTLLETADHDDRVVPSHTLKYIARLYELLQEAEQYQTNPILASIEKSAGHGAGKPLTKAMDELVKEFSFLQLTLNLKWKD
uniref:Prolyl endopeptidase n=1 Tax=Parastrongyloides trichosuri TaxID=131310 RepID=A0A0N5A2X4_PARTI